MVSNDARPPVDRCRPDWPVRQAKGWRGMCARSACPARARAPLPRPRPQAEPESEPVQQSRTRIASQAVANAARAHRTGSTRPISPGSAGQRLADHIRRPASSPTRRC